MARFAWNRQTSLILAVILSLAVGPVFSGAVRADMMRTSTEDPTTPGGPGVPNGAGDPDMPVGPSVTVRPESRIDGISSPGVRTEGDGRAQSDVMMWRIRIILQALKVLYIRF